MATLRRNLITKTDSYKWSHPAMFPEGTTGTFDYTGARVGGAHREVLWVPLLQYTLPEYLAGSVVTQADLDEALDIRGWHFDVPVPQDAWVAGWLRIIHHHEGRLPLRIRAVREGSLIPAGHPLMTVESTDKQIPWLPGHFEGLLEKVWYPTTVATKGWHIKHQTMIPSLIRTGCDPAFADFMLHDFGYRACTSEESAWIGGAAHLVNFKGTDTIEAMRFLRHYYGAAAEVGKSVAATQHTIMTAKGRCGEHGLALHLIATHQNRILSQVGDSFDYYAFVDFIIDNDDVIDRYHCKIVIRPDSTTPTHKTPSEIVRWTLNRLATRLPVTTTQTGHKIVKRPELYGDGLSEAVIADIVRDVEADGFAASNVIYGMGGGAVQKGIDRDTERVATKTSAQERDGVWHDTVKEPLDQSKRSRGGRLKLIYSNHAGFETIRESDHRLEDDLLEPVFENGIVLRSETWEVIKARAAQQKLQSM